MEHKHLFFPISEIRNPNTTCTGNTRLTDGEKTEHPGTPGLEDAHRAELPGFVFTSLYTRLGGTESGNKENAPTKVSLL